MAVGCRVLQPRHFLGRSETPGAQEVRIEITMNTPGFWIYLPQTREKMIGIGPMSQHSLQDIGALSVSVRTVQIAMYRPRAAVACS
jgi:hypothetical protein